MADRVMRSFWSDQVSYFRHIAGLFRPGTQVAIPAVHPVQPGPLANWGEDDLGLMIDEGRRRLDRQFSDYEHILGRAQWVFTVGSAVIVSLAAALGKPHPSPLGVALGVLAVLVLVYGVAGAAAIMVVRADFSIIDTANLSHYEPPITRQLAADYSSMLRIGENTLAARLSVFHEAVLYVIVGGILGLLAVFAHG